MENAIITSNLRLVYYLARKYQGMGLSLEDLIQEGSLGLCMAKEKWNPEKGAFGTYAGEWIKAMIRQALNKSSRMVRIPAHLIGETESAPVQELDNNYAGTVQPEAYATVEQQHTQLRLELMLKKLKPKQRRIIELKFGIGCHEMKTAEIAEIMGLTVQAVNGHIRQGLAVMKSM